jgi:hypothetical protein
LKSAAPRDSKKAAAATRDAWLARARKMPAAKRVVAIERQLRTLPKTPTTANISFRKQLLRLWDASRLEAGMISKADLHRENSPFAGMDFRSAKINFVHAFVTEQISPQARRRFFVAKKDLFFARRVAFCLSFERFWLR